MRKLTTAREQQRAALALERASLGEGQAKLEAEQERLRLEAEELSQLRRRHEARTRMLDDVVKARAEAEIATAKRERDELEARAVSLQQELQKHKDSLAKVERHAGRSFDEVLTSLAEAERAREVLKSQIRHAPGPEVVEERDRLRDERDEQRDELTQLRKELVSRTTTRTESRSSR